MDDVQELPPLGVYLVLVRMPAAPALLALATACCTEAERGQAERFLRPIDQQRRLLGRGLARYHLGRLLGLAPGNVPLQRGAHGKPMLPDGTGWHFNISHAGSWVLLGLTASGEIGLDVEELSRLEDATALARLACTPAERQALALLPDAQQQRAFLDLWVGKEAWLKCRGTGLTRDPSGLHLGLDDAGAWPTTPDGLHLQRFAPDDGHRAAVATPFPAQLLRISPA